MSKIDEFGFGVNKVSDEIGVLIYLPYKYNASEIYPVKLIISKPDGAYLRCSVCAGEVDSPDIHCKWCGVKFNGWKEFFKEETE